MRTLSKQGKARIEFWLERVANGQCVPTWLEEAERFDADAVELSGAYTKSGKDEIFILDDSCFEPEASGFVERFHDGQRDQAFPWREEQLKLTRGTY